MVVGWSVGEDHQVVDLRTDGLQYCTSISFRVENINVFSVSGPVATRTRWFGGTAADAGDDHLLAFFAIIFKDLADFEECNVCISAICVALSCGEQARQQGRTHVGHICGDRICQ